MLNLQDKMRKLPSLTMHKNKNLIIGVLLAISVISSSTSVVFYSLWRSSEPSPEVTSELIDDILPTKAPSTPNFIYPPSGDEKDAWQAVSARFDKQVTFELALPKDLPYTEAASDYNQSDITYRVFENEAMKQTSIDCENTYIAWKKQRQANSDTSGAPAPCNPNDPALFSISFNTATYYPQASEGIAVTSANYRNWMLSEENMDGVNGHYYLSGMTQLSESNLILKVVIEWQDERFLKTTESLLGYDANTFLKNVLSQISFGEHSMYELN